MLVLAFKQVTKPSQFHVFSSAKKLLFKLLGFKNLRISQFDFRPRQGILHLFVKPHKCGARCPECDRRCLLVKRGKSTRKSRTWRDIPLGGLSVALHYAPREIRCPTHGRRQENIPWAHPKSQCTQRLEFHIMKLCQAMPQKEVAQLCGLPTSTMADILHRIIKRYRKGHKIRGLTEIGIDEISYKKGHRYLTVVYDLERHCVVWVGEGKGRETIDRFFNEALSKGQRSRIRVACCDMSQAYMGAINDHLPKALLVLDRFHIAKALNEAVDEVRKQQWRHAAPAMRKELKGLRFVLLKNPRNRTAKERQLLAAVAREQKRIFRACELKDRLAHFWEYQSVGWAEKFLNNWCRSAMLSRLEPLKKFVGMVREHWDGVMASITGSTNAVAEGINRLLRLAKNRASGYRSSNNFINMIMLIAGDLNLPTQVPAQNRPRQTKPITFHTLLLPAS